MKKRYTEEQKQDAVRLSSEPGRSVESVAEELGIGKSSLAKWRAQYGTMHKKFATLSAEQQKIRELERKLKQRDEELAFLKKTAVFFASQKA